ncbi:MAG: ATP-binding cassette domain-containing protein [Nitriliruptorales bacterium]|nr:ATP-binding cassette domain-containing protein [Nitriliruptorales bacterium]
MTDQLLSVDGVSKSFPGVKALKDVHVDLYPGEVHAVVGENGAGKSTLMKIVAGIYQPDAGTIRLDGEPVEVPGPLAAQHLGISIIHQELMLMPHLTVAENIYIGREKRRGPFIDDKDLNRRARKLFDRLGISLDPRTKVSTLVVAEQQVAEIAKALSFNARVLIMDEPTAALTESETEALFGMIRDLKEQGTGILYISHRMEELRGISDRITVLRDGEYIGTVQTAETDLRQVISMMVGREIKGETRPDVEAVERPAALKVTGLSTRHLLDDVSFELKQGEILGFAGLMGAGRTEVARAICGADPSTAGEIEVHGRPATIRTPADAARLGIGYLSEDRKRYGLMLDLDVNLNILISSLTDYTNVVGMVRDEAGREASRKYVGSMKIKTPSIRQRAKNLSGGNQQKIVIAKWLAKDCDILIFDEPTRGIDVGAKEEIYALLESLAQQGKAIMMISSELPEVLRMSHRIVVMSEGRVTGILDNAEADQETIMDYATRAKVHGGIEV